MPLSLGTDTAGPGRVPAAFSNIVGLKPTCGMVSTTGVVPACRSLDCVSIFSLTVDDAIVALNVIAGVDAADPYSPLRPLRTVGAIPAGIRLGVLPPGQRIFFGDNKSAAAYDEALAGLARLGGKIMLIDFAPLKNNGKLAIVSTPYSNGIQYMANRQRQRSPLGE